MKTDIDTNNSSDIEMEACAWIAQLETGDLTTEDLAAYREWMSRSSAHRAEIKRLAYLSYDLNILTEMAPSLTKAIDAHKGITEKHSDKPLKKLSYLVASMILVVTIISLGGYIGQKQSPTETPIVVTTAIGNHRDIKLSDGSVVNINTNSKLEIDFNNQRRKVRLLKGEAFFQVAHNPNRPFIVYAGEKSIRAVGTAFIVKLQPDNFEVTVTEGHIELTKTASTNLDVVEIEQIIKPKSPIAHQPASTPIFLKAGETVVYKNSKKELIEEISVSEIERKLAWQNGFLDFSDTTLVEVIEDLSRYTSLQIEISDPELRELKFGGLFKMDEIEGFFDALNSGYNIKAEYGENGTVHLKRHSESKVH